MTLTPDAGLLFSPDDAAAPLHECPVRFLDFFSPCMYFNVLCLSFFFCTAPPPNGVWRGLQGLTGLTRARGVRGYRYRPPSPLCFLIPAPSLTVNHCLLLLLHFITRFIRRPDWTPARAGAAGARRAVPSALARRPSPPPPPPWQRVLVTDSH